MAASRPHMEQASSDEGSYAMTTHCLICCALNAEPHHHPRRSAGTQFGKLIIPTEDPRRSVPACRLCHEAIHKHGYVFERFRDGLLFTLDSVVERPGMPDADYLRDAEGTLVWQDLIPPVNMDEAVADRADACRTVIDGLQPLIPYLNADQVAFAFGMLQELGSQNIWKQRALLEEQAIRVTFGWHVNEKQVVCPDCGKDKPYGKSWGHRDKVAAVARTFGVSPRTVDYDLAAAPALHEGYDGPRSGASVAADKPPVCPSPNSPDGRHLWEILHKRCKLCGKEKG